MCTMEYQRVIDPLGHWDVDLQHKITLYMLVVTVINDDSRL